MSITVTAKIKDVFFDRRAVKSILLQMDKETANNLRRAGNLLRTIARRSLRRRKKASSPGSPPSVHSKSNYATLKNILYGLSENKQSVIAGPVGFSLRRKRGVVFQSRSVPNVHEFGGSVHRVRALPKLSSVRRGGRPVSQAQKAAFFRKIKSREIVRPAQSYTHVEENRTYPKRPFMRPALEEVMRKHADIWKLTVLQ